MKILIITQYYPPEIGAAASRWGDYVSIMTQRGYNLTVVCEAPNYPNGQYYTGYKNKLQDVEFKSNNLNIIRTMAFATNRKSKIKKLLHYFTFMFSGALLSIRLKNFDLVIVSSPPLFVGIIGLIYSKIHSKSYWLDLRDLWPESVTALGQLKRGVFYKIAKKIENCIYKSAKGFILAVPEFKNYLDENPYSSEKPKLNLINGVSRKFIREAEKTSNTNDKQFTVLYSGNIGLAQKLETILDAAHKLRNLPINFKFIGNGVQEDYLRRYAKEKKLNNIHFENMMIRKDLIYSIKKSSVCMAPLANKKLFKNAIPSKILEYLACKRPVICNDGSAGEIIKKAKGGLVVEAENSTDLARAIKHYYENQSHIEIHGLNGFKYVCEKFIKEELVSDLLKKMSNEN